MFVSGVAHEKLLAIAQDKKCFLGDVVDLLLELKTVEQLGVENKKFKRLWTP